MSFDDANKMSLRELFNAIKGFFDIEESRTKADRAIAWATMQQHAMWTAWSKKQSKNIGRQKPPWKKQRTREDGRPKVLNYDDMKGMFEGLAEKRKN